MKIGYTVVKENMKLLENKCENVSYFERQTVTPQTFFEFVKENKNKQIVIPNVADIGLQLVQMMPALELIEKQKKNIIFLEKNFGRELSDSNYNLLLLEYARNEKEIMSHRAHHGIQRAKEKGTKYGRPKLNQELVEKIQCLSKNQSRSVREIAEICRVSTSTVHKYAKQ